MRHTFAAMIALLVVAAVGDSNDAGKPKPRDGRRFDFLPTLELTLQKGLLDGNKHARAACLALLFCEDKKLVDRALGALLCSKAGAKEVLASARRRLAKGRDDKHSPIAEIRLAALLGLTSLVRDGHAFLELTVEHWDSRSCGLGCAGDIHRIRPYLVGSFGRGNVPPGPPVEKDTPNEVHFVWEKPGETAKRQAAWKKWLRWADRKKVNAAMFRWWKDGAAACRRAEQEMMKPATKPAMPGSAPATK